MLDYRPDLDPATPGYLTAVSDFLPTEKGYKVANASGAQTAHALTLAANESPINSLFATRWLSTPGGIIIAGTNKDLYVYEYTNGFIKVSKGGGYNLTGSAYLYGEDSGASFDQCAFGDVLIATHKSVVPQYRSALDRTIATLYANLGTTVTAPKASVCATSSNFVFLGDLGSTWGSATSVVGAPNMVAWCGIGDHQNWDITPTTSQGSYAQFTDTPGPITALAPFADGIVVFKATSMYLGRYVGAGSNSPIWDFIRISDRIGCIGHHSWTDIGGQLVFVGTDDAYSFDGTRPQSITRGIWETEFARGTVGQGVYPIWVGHDRPNGCVLFAKAGTQTWLVWSYRFNRWSTYSTTDGNSTVPVTGFYQYCPVKANTNDFRSVTTTAYSGTISSDHTNIYTLFAATSALDGLGVNPTESKIYNRGGGAAHNAAYMTTWAIGNDEKVTKIDRLVPRWAKVPSSATLTVQVRNVLGDGWTSLGSVSMNSTTRRFDLLSLGGAAANWHEFTLTVTGNSGGASEVVDLDAVMAAEHAKPAGKR